MHICLPSSFQHMDRGGNKTAGKEGRREAACCMLSQVRAELHDIPAECTSVPRVWIGL